MYVDKHPVLEKYLSSLPDWKPLLKDNWLILDSDAIVSIVEQNAAEITNDFQVNNTTLTTIDPVVKQIMSTDSSTKRTTRHQITQKLDILYLDSTIIRLSNELQELLINYNCYPDPIDLYLGGTLAKLKQNQKTFLATSNLKHFPFPVFKRISGIVLQNPKGIKIISILKLDPEPSNRNSLPF